MVSPFRIGKTVNPRRLSVNDSFHDVENNIRRAVARLNELWDEIHMSESARVARVSTAFGHISNLLNDMVVSEETMVAGVAKEIESGTLEINKMRSQLEMEPWQNTRAPPGSIELRNSIDSELKKLRPLYEKRRKEQNELAGRVGQLLFRLGIEDDNPVSASDGELLPEDKVAALDARRIHLEDMLQKRLKRVQRWQKEMKKFVSKLGKDVLEDENMLAVMQVDFTSEETCVTDAMIATMEGYHKQLLEMFTEYVDEREFRWLELYTRLSELWDLCHVADIERMISPTYDPEKHSDKDFDKISTEISRLDSLYAARKDVFDVLTAWKEKWAEKIALEEKKKSPEYFQNRGRENNVYMDAKIERTLNDYTLPKLLKTLIDTYEEYKKSHPRDEIRVDGFTPPDYVKWVIDEYNASKELERKNRQMQRMASTSSLRTPQSARAKLSQRPVSSSKIEPLRKGRFSEQRSASERHKTPKSRCVRTRIRSKHYSMTRVSVSKPPNPHARVSAKRLRYDSTLSPCFNSTAASTPSVITPTKRGKIGPKHSSPKFSTPKMGSNRKRTPRSAAKASRDTRTPFRPSNKPQ